MNHIRQIATDPVLAALAGYADALSSIRLGGVCASIPPAGVAGAPAHSSATFDVAAGPLRRSRSA